MKKMLTMMTLLAAVSSYAVEVDGLVVIFKDGKSSFANKSAISAASTRSIAKSINAFKVSLPKFFNKSSLGHMARRLKLDPNVKYVMKNVKLQRRDKVVSFLPNDTEWAQLWGLSEASETNTSSNALKAWKAFGTPNKTKLGEEVVVAVVDEGVDLSHPDLQGNLYTNPAEIADDGIDNDGNGYVDDVHGFDFTNQSGDVDPGFHGTHVAGTVSAVGNNNEGVIGVSPNTKVLTAGGQMYVATALEAYEYVYNVKKAYLESKGTRGANVVATNSSFGYDEADCTSTDYAAFNDMFNKLGSVGVLNAAATMNWGLNVDVVGDVPTGCESPYIIAVTNIAPTGELDSAAFGIKSIDIAAPGADIISTIPGAGYRSLSGTSMATPHVAGAIAYLHAVASAKFASEVKNDPAAAALKLRDILLKSVTKTKYLSTKVSTGGHLDLFKAASEIVK